MVLASSVFRIRQTVNGIRYSKTIRLDDLRSLSILSWKALYRGRDSSGAGLYYFIPSKFVCTTAAGRTVIRKRLRQFDALILSNRYGSTRLYAYFADYWSKGRWRNSGSDDFHYNGTHPNPACLVRIVFCRSSGKKRARGR